jgi:hypothetical protein
MTFGVSLSTTAGTLVSNEPSTPVIGMTPALPL